jgi:hypothetical protein
MNKGEIRLNDILPQHTYSDGNEIEKLKSGNLKKILNAEICAIELRQTEI